MPVLGDQWVCPRSGLVMVYVPAGEFTMGSVSNEDEQPPHTVRLTQGYWVGLTPVTNAMYAQFVAAGGYTTQAYWPPDGWRWKGRRDKPEDYRNFTAPDQPRVGVNWFEAVAFCNWANLRLPTEAEWEYAARGPQSLTYPWGNDFDPRRVIYHSNAGGKTAPVGAGVRQSGASWCGALDMSGNVWEWVADFYHISAYASHSPEDPTGPTTGSTRVLRGGSINDGGGWSLRSAAREWSSPDFRNKPIGFRPARAEVS
jgi:formylglycine-generating enzyme required for sulfatase activity